jgi:hypothetical protein
VSLLLPARNTLRLTIWSMICGSAVSWLLVRSKYSRLVSFFISLGSFLRKLSLICAFFTRVQLSTPLAHEDVARVHALPLEAICSIGVLYYAMADAYLQHLQVCEVADGRRQLCDLIARQRQLLQVLHLPHRLAQPCDSAPPHKKTSSGWMTGATTQAAAANNGVGNNW